MAAEIVLYLLILVWVDTRRMQNLGLCGPNADPVAPLTKTALADDAATDAATEAYLDMKFGAMANYDAVKPKPKADAPAERKRPSVTLKADLVSDVAQLPMDMESVAARTSWETKDEEELMREEAEDAAAEQAELEAPMGLAGLSDMGAAAAAPPIGGAACAACAPSLGGGKKKSATNPFGI